MFMGGRLVHVGLGRGVGSPRLRVGLVGLRRRRQRRGITILLVLMLMSITLSLSYAILRSQTTTVMIQNNNQRTNTARADAISGMAIALRQMSDGTWRGVGSTVSGSLSATDSYQVTYTAGDASLAAGSSNYGQNMYRVTLLSTGTSQDPVYATLTSTYQISAVVTLNPRALTALPSGWSSMTAYTVYQTDVGQFSVDVPSQISGPVWLQGATSICNGYNWSSSAQTSYLSGLASMASSGDYRPLTGPVSWDSWFNYGSTSALQTLGVSTTNVGFSGFGASLPLPSSPVTYSLYQGGPVYSAATISGTVSNATLGADAIHNPLGVYYANSNLTLGGNVTLQGTLICNGQLTISGTGVSLAPCYLEALSGTTATIRLPTVITSGNVECTSGGNVTASGTFLVGQQFSVDTGSQASVFNFTGHLICGGNFVIGCRNEWNVSTNQWNAWYSGFQGQPKKNGKVTYPYFPQYLAALGYSPVPLVMLQLDTSQVVDQWQSLSSPIYVPASGDVGLHWDLVSWVEIP